MKLSTLALIALALGLFQLTSLHYFKFFGAQPDLFLVSVVLASLFLEGRQAVIFSLALGIFKDAFTLSAFGADILLFSLWSFLIVKITRKVSIEDNLSRTLLLFIIALLQNIISGLVLVYSGSFIPLGIFLRLVFFGALYTALLLPLILKIMKVRV
ncbi:MAG: rod shape-determining protein MreD [Candidatus Omnitrophica bacterium]|nr:rod shape-determining protein MreD [Candidatus Omnitrophota bacterium]